MLLLCDEMYVINCIGYKRKFSITTSFHPYIFNGSEERNAGRERGGVKRRGAQRRRGSGAGKGQSESRGMGGRSYTDQRRLCTHEETEKLEKGETTGKIVFI